MWHCNNMAGAGAVRDRCCFFASPSAAIASHEHDFMGDAAIFGLEAERGGSSLCARGALTTNTILLADSEEFDMNYLRLK